MELTVIVVAELYEEEIHGEIAVGNLECSIDEEMGLVNTFASKSSLFKDPPVPQIALRS